MLRHSDRRRAGCDYQSEMCAAAAVVAVEFDRIALSLPPAKTMKRKLRMDLGHVVQQRTMGWSCRQDWKRCRHY